MQTSEMYTQNVAPVFSDLLFSVSGCRSLTAVSVLLAVSMGIGSHVTLR